MLLAEDTLATMERRARSFGAPVAVVEVRATTDSNDQEPWRRHEALELRVVLAAPGWEDSRYRVESLGRLNIDDPRAAPAVMEMARRLADTLAAPLHPDSPAPPARAGGDKEWMELQGPPPDRPWKMRWCLKVWRPDGTSAQEGGERVTLAPSEKQAIELTRSELTRGLVPPFSCGVAALDTNGRGHPNNYEAGYPRGAEKKETLRAWALDGQPLSTILRGLASGAPGLSPLDHMVALAHAFLLELDTLAPAGAFCRGSLSDAELDAALGPAVESMKFRWRLPLDLRGAYARGASIGPVMQAHYRTDRSAIQLIVGLREAFDLSLRDAKMIMSTACDGEHDDEVDSMLKSALHVEGRPGDDERRAFLGALSALNAGRER